jgi:DNA-binding beta-propeller fold protein YncE
MQIKSISVQTALGAVMLMLCASVYAQNLSLLWSIEDVFSSPESAAYDPASGAIFVSNVNGYAKDGNGFISKVSADGSEQNIRWLSGLDSPTGIAIHNGKLYFADYDRLIIADIQRATILAEYFAPDEKPSLNDVVVSASGQVFVSGSSSNSIYKLADGKLEIWKHDNELLALANGLFIRDGVLIHAGARWSEFDISSKELLSSGLETESFKNFDGIADDGCGGYLVTLLDDKRIWQLTASRQARPFSAQPINGIDLQNFKNTLFVPIVGDGLAVFSLAETRCQGVSKTP